MRRPDRIMTRTMLLERVWDFDFDPKTNIVETHISRLRGKLNAGHAVDAIETVRGAGYRLQYPGPEPRRDSRPGPAASHGSHRSRWGDLRSWPKCDAGLLQQTRGHGAGH